jgi:hypothetical protein
MAESQSLPPSEPLAVFLSYSHVDEKLKEELDAHLSTLKRLDRIKTWNDRSIVAGDNWKKEIDTQLVGADVILLLVSSDFINSDFCYSTEALNALDRHDRGQALVVPIVLRPVDFHGLPIADLQMLPKDAKPVISDYWSSRDEAFENIAKGIRKAIEKFRQNRSTFKEFKEKDKIELESRYLDAAIAKEIPFGESREVVAVVRLATSKGLRAILPEQVTSESTYSCTRSDVRDDSFHARFKVAGTGDRTSFAYRLTIQSLDVEISDEDKHFNLEWGVDSIVFKFLIKSSNFGEHMLRLNLYSNDVPAVETLLKTATGTLPLPGGGPMLGRLISSVQLIINVISKSQSVAGA